MRILVLGKDGMLGSTLESFLKRKDLDVSATTRREGQRGLFLNVDPKATTVDSLVHLLNDFDVVVNCIVVRSLSLDSHLPEAIYANAIFPHIVARSCMIAGKAFINISTDGVFSGFGGPYVEGDLVDGQGLYSNSKILGEVAGPKSLNIRCSIVGHENPANGGLLSWVLSQETAITGFTNVVWNGVTTVQLANFIFHLITSDRLQALISQTHVIHFSPNKPMTKYELLQKICDVYGKNIDIIEAKSKVAISRVLNSKFSEYFEKSDDFSKELRELRDFHYT